MRVKELKNFTYAGANPWDGADFWRGTIIDDNGDEVHVQIMNDDPRDSNPENVVRALMKQLRDKQIDEDFFARQLMRYDDPEAIAEEKDGRLVSEFVAIEDFEIKDPHGDSKLA